MDPTSNKRKREEDDDRSSDGDDDGKDLEGFIIPDEEEISDEVEEEEEKPQPTSDDETRAAIEEAQRLTQNLASTVVGGRVLRDRGAIKKPQTYFDTEAYTKLLLEDDKKEKLALLKKWALSGEYIGKPLNKKSSVEEVDTEYQLAKLALDIPDSDDEEEEEEEEEDDEDEEEEEEEEEDEEETETDDEADGEVIE